MTRVLLLLFNELCQIVCGFMMSWCWQYLSDTSHLVKQKALEVLGELLPVGLQADTTIKLISDYTHSQDARVRSKAFNTMVQTLHNQSLSIVIQSLIVINPRGAVSRKLHEELRMVDSTGLLICQRKNNNIHMFVLEKWYKVSKFKFYSIKKVENLIKIVFLQWKRIILI